MFVYKDWQCVGTQIADDFTAILMVWMAPHSWYPLDNIWTVAIVNALSELDLLTK